MFYRNKTNDKGFTLIELLIVIVIIGILAGVVIGVLNPVQQQNKAKDGTLKSSMSKITLSAKSLMVTQNTGAPLISQFVAGLSNITPGSGTTNCVDSSGNTVASDSVTLCDFNISGISTPATCTSSYNGDGGSTQCSFRYYRPDATGSFRLLVKGHAKPRGMIVFDYNVNSTTGAVTEGFYVCNDGTGGTLTDASTFTEATSLNASGFTCTKY